MNNSRRTFVRNSLSAGAALSILGIGSLSSCGNKSAGTAASQVPETQIALPSLAEAEAHTPFFKLSLAQWSVHKLLNAKQLSNLEFPALAASLGFEAVEYVNQFFADKAEDKAYLNQLNSAAVAAGVNNLLIMVDGEGELSDQNEAKRQQAIENHYKWISAAAYLGCHSIRVNLYGNGSPEQQRLAAVDSLRKLSAEGARNNINVLVENHGGLSSDAKWLANVIHSVGSTHCGTLPDFGNFCIEQLEQPDDNGNSCAREYNRYDGMQKLMAYAKGVSAKSYNFGDDGLETLIDFREMLRIVRNAGYRGHIGVEYEGSKLPPREGITATRNLLLRASASLG